MNIEYEDGYTFVTGLEHDEYEAQDVVLRLGAAFLRRGYSFEASVGEYGDGTWKVTVYGPQQRVTEIAQPVMR